MALLKNKSANKKKRLENRTTPTRSVDDLIQQLSDSNPTSRRWAVRDLTNHPEAVEPLIQQLRQEGNASVREVIFTALRTLGNENVVKGLIPFLKSEDAALRNGVIEILRTLPDAMGHHVEGLLKDDNSDVRIFAVDILREIAHPNLLFWLHTILEQESHVNVCASAVDCLVEVGTSESLPFLHTLKERFVDEPFLAFVVDTAIRRIENAG